MSQNTLSTQPPETEPRFVGDILLDAPAHDPVLGFQEVAAALASIIENSQPRFAVGIFGGWGSGKSTLMEAIRAKIDQESSVVVPFNAWRYEREPHLIVPLLDTIRGGLAQWATDHSGDEASRAESIAGRVGRVVRALTRSMSAEVGVPGVATVTIDASKAMQELGRDGDDVTRTAQSLYHAAFTELSDAFTQVSGTGFSRIIVFVDDLDRCLPSSALTVLESIKLFFDMPGFVFVVGLDERVVQRAVEGKFSPETTPGPEGAENRLEREYLHKIFQVPFTVPTMAPAQLEDLLNWITGNGTMGAVQRDDLRSRVRRYLRYVAVEGRVNPRDVKRFINAYTLQRMIRPDLQADVLLALQTIDFRPDWEKLYDVLLAEPDVLVDALRRYREADSHAFKNIWPELSVLPAELVDFLRSPDAEPLASAPDIERYVSSLQSARSPVTWLHDAIRDVGQLRQLVRDVSPSIGFATEPASSFAEEVQTVLGRLERRFDPADKARIEGPVQRLQQLLEPLTPDSPSEQSGPTGPQEFAEWQRSCMAQVDLLQEELRLIRRASAFAQG